MIKKNKEQTETRKDASKVAIKVYNLIKKEFASEGFTLNDYYRVRNSLNMLVNGSKINIEV